MKIEIIGTRGWSYAGHEDLIRELGPRFIRDGHTFTIHAWATEETISRGIKTDIIQNGVKIIFHKTSYGKYSGQFIIALKASFMAAFSECDIVYYAFIQNGIYSWIPRIFGKKVLSNVDGIMWKDPKWPIIFRYIFFPIGAYLTILFSNKTITDSYHMKLLYMNKFKVNIDWIGYGCNSNLPEKKRIDLVDKYPCGYHLIMSRITPHNLTDLIIDGYIISKSEIPLVIAGHIPDNKWFRNLSIRTIGKNIKFLGLIKDQDHLTQIILNAKAYLHGHSLGGINPALVRVTSLNVPAICIDTVFNREVVEYPNNKLQAILFKKDPNSVANAIQEFEKKPVFYKKQAEILGDTIRKTMNWDIIYSQYKNKFLDCFHSLKY